MKTEQEHIETVEQVIWDWLQSHYQESCYTTELGKFTNALCDFWKIYNDNKDEIERLKAEIIYLERKIAIRDNALKDSDKAIEMLEGKQDTIVKQAKIDVLKELKKRARTSYVLDDFILGSVVFSKDIDELIKEVEEQ